ncbi:ComEC family competence protein [Gammaproteobacteria bacterium MOLA455]|nr:ComEC family competence protein [Gammaproteobacteria bacterium MOLA455]
MTYLIMLSLGVFSVAWWAWLPGFGISSGLFILLLTVSVYFRLKGLIWLVSLSAGMLWGIFSGHQLLSKSLPDKYSGEEFLISGHIVSLVDSNSVRSRFSFAPESIQALSDPDQQPIPGKLLLSWYAAEALHPGQRWTLVVRLRRPRGFVNPGTFDYQSWLLQQGYMATGYVRSSEPVRQLPNSRFLTAGNIASLPAQLRARIQQSIEQSELSPRGRAVLLALSIGDKRQLANWWQDLARLGIVHLLVISGLHIGLVALFGAAFGKGLARLVILIRSACNALGFRSPSLELHWLAPVCGVLAAAAYSLLAGFSLPTQRALIAVAVVVTAKLCFRRIQPFVCLVWALALIALLQPLAALSAGFWLSFTAVAVLITWFSPWQSSDSWWPKKRTVSAQLALLVIMSVPLVLFMGRLSWLAPLVNLIAVPWVSLVTVPSVLLGCLVLPVSNKLAEAIWTLSDWSVELLWTFLHLLPSDQGFLVSPVGASSLVLLAALLAGLCLMLPRQFSERWLGVLPLALLLVFNARPKVGLRVTVLDVGQGLAVVVETDQQSLLYDSGAQFSPAFSVGSGIVAPFLWQRGWSAINTTVISHEDGDHSGGFASLQQVLPSVRLITGPGVDYPEALLQGQNVEICRAGIQWRWGEVLFEILSPAVAADSLESGPNIGSAYLRGNNSSCVLRIRWRDIQVLLPGDIESGAENELLDSGWLDSAQVDLLIAPHHGSKTSSTARFVQQLRPKHVIFSAGYQHQFGHPHPSVVKRYNAVDSRIWNTAEQGAITFEWLSTRELFNEASKELDKEPSITTARGQEQRWWR